MMVFRKSLLLLVILSACCLSGCFTKLLTQEVEYESSAEHEMHDLSDAVVKGQSDTYIEDGMTWRRVQFDGLLVGGERFVDVLLPPRDAFALPVLQESEKRITGELIWILISDSRPNLGSRFSALSPGDLIDGEAFAQEVFKKNLSPSGRFAIGFFEDPRTYLADFYLVILEQSAPDTWRVVEVRCGDLYIERYNFDWDEREVWTVVGMSFGYLLTLPLDIITFPVQLPFLALL